MLTVIIRKFEEIRIDMRFRAARGAANTLASSNSFDRAKEYMDKSSDIFRQLRIIHREGLIKKWLGHF